MKFGDYLKQQRESKQWTQPTAAQNVGIEQSYLSKLETGKSYPSEDIFDRLIEAYDITTSEMTQLVSSAELQKLKNIKEVRAAILGYYQHEQSLVRNWLFAGLACLMLGGASLGLALLPDQANQHFLYRSEGVLLPGEALSAFDVIGQHRDLHREGQQQLRTRQQAMIERLDQKEKVLSTNRAKSFVENGPDGRRFYELYNVAPEEGALSLRWFIVPALMLLFGSAGCFLIGFRWKRS